MHSVDSSSPARKLLATAVIAVMIGSACSSGASPAATSAATTAAAAAATTAAAAAATTAAAAAATTAAAAAATYPAGCAVANALDPAALIPASVVSTSQFNEKPSTLDSLTLTDAQAAKAKAGKYKIGIAMQTMTIDWSKLVVQGITDTLAKYDATVVSVTDPNFDPVKQTAQIGDMITLHPDAIISMATDLTATAPAYKKIGQAGIKLILMHMVPKGLTYPTDYQSVISPDNEGNGQVSAQILSQYIPKNGVVGIVDYGVDFFTTNVRTARFKTWMTENRPDITLKQVEFIDTTKAGDAAANFLTANPNINGLFVVWDDPAMQVVSAMRAQGKDLPVVTIDLGNQDAIELAKCGAIKGLSGQQPYDQGVGEAEAALLALIGVQPPSWVVLPSVPVVPKNVLTAYKTIWHTDPPKELVDACNTSGACQ
jgi:ribose transport system substrate-binding protein